MLAVKAGSKVPAKHKAHSSVTCTIINYHKLIGARDEKGDMKRSRRIGGYVGREGIGMGKGKRKGKTDSGLPRSWAMSLEAFWAISFLLVTLVLVLISRTGIVKGF